MIVSLRLFALNKHIGGVLGVIMQLDGVWTLIASALMLMKAN